MTRSDAADMREVGVPREGDESDRLGIPDASAGRPRAGGPRFGRLRLRQLHLLASGLAGVLFLLVLTRPLASTPPNRAGGANPADQLHRLVAAQTGLDIGRRAPGVSGAGDDLQITDLDGRAVSLADYAGKPLWIVFWATWCPACQREMPDLIDAYREHRPDGLVIVAINAQEAPEVVRRHVTDNAIPYPVVLDPGSAARNAYGVIGLPSHYFIDRYGVIHQRAFGRLERDTMGEYLRLILDRQPTSEGGGG
ncbi:MAG: TlpA family protein disulfide reductase [Candidatus Limnocylindria bacterium]